MKIEIAPGEFNGHLFVTIWELDNNGVRYKKPVISLSKKKIKIIEENISEIKQLLGMTSKPNQEQDIPF
jgi:hypothetical protein